MLQSGGASVQGGVYILFNGPVLYIGQFSGMRAGDRPGLRVRCAEHIQALLRPTTQEGKRPVIWCTTQTRAHAAEQVAITIMQPAGNKRDTRHDTINRGQGTLLGKPKRPRHRPSSWRRQPNCHASIWRTNTIHQRRLCLSQLMRLFR